MSDIVKGEGFQLDFKNFTNSTKEVILNLLLIFKLDKFQIYIICAYFPT